MKEQELTTELNNELIVPSADHFPLIRRGQHGKEKYHRPHAHSCGDDRQYLRHLFG